MDGQVFLLPLQDCASNRVSERIAQLHHDPSYGPSLVILRWLLEPELT